VPFPDVADAPSGLRRWPDPHRLFERPADLARLAAQAELRRVQARATGARITGVGRPEVALGDAVRLADVGSADGTYQVRDVRHRLNRRHGFTTSVELWSIP